MRLNLRYSFVSLALLCLATLANAQTTIDPLTLLRAKTSAGTNLAAGLTLVTNGAGGYLNATVASQLTAGLGISINLTTGEIVNTARDQVVTFTGGGVTGTYPNFTSTSTPFQTLTTGGTTSPTITLSDGGGTVTLTSATGGAFSRSGNTFTYTPVVSVYQTFSTVTDGTTTLSNGGQAFRLIGTGAATVTTTTAGLYTIDVPVGTAPMRQRYSETVATAIASGGTQTLTGTSLPTDLTALAVYIDGSLMWLDAANSARDASRASATTLTWNRAVPAGSRVTVWY